MGLDLFLQQLGEIYFIYRVSKAQCKHLFYLLESLQGRIRTAITEIIASAADMRSSTKLHFDKLANSRVSYPPRCWRRRCWRKAQILAELVFLATG